MATIVMLRLETPPNYTPAVRLFSSSSPSVPHSLRQSVVPADCLATSTSVRTPKPLPPASSQGLLDSKNAGPAISRCTHGLPATNSSRNLAAVIAPPQRPSPTFLMSATSLRICSPYSENIGSCHSGSPAASAADFTALAHSWLFVIKPAT